MKAATDVSMISHRGRAPYGSRAIESGAGSSKLSEPPVISIVDDDESVRAAVESLVRSLGYTAHVFASAEAFLRSPQLPETSCLVTDVHMPGMTGLDLYGALVERRQNMPVIFISAFPEARICQQAEAIGEACFLSKPFDGNVFIERLSAALRRSGEPTA